MAAPATAHLRYNVDTNVLIDLAKGIPVAQRLLAKLRLNNCAVGICPTVIQELTYLALDEKGDPGKYALIALQNLRHWGVFPYDLSGCGHGITDQAANKIIGAGLLPEAEYHDGLIIAETALVDIPTLISGDIHMLEINPAKLVSILTENDLYPISIYSPRQMLP